MPNSPKEVKFAQGNALRQSMNHQGWMDDFLSYLPISNNFERTHTYDGGEPRSLREQSKERKRMEYMRTIENR